MIPPIGPEEKPREIALRRLEAMTDVISPKPSSGCSILRIKVDRLDYGPNVVSIVLRQVVLVPAGATSSVHAERYASVITA